MISFISFSKIMIMIEGSENRSVMHATPAILSDLLNIDMHVYTVHVIRPAKPFSICFFNVQCVFL